VLNVELDEATGIVILSPDGTLSESDFTAAGRVIDPFIDKSGKLNGLIISTETFPGWDSFAALTKHFQFVKDHHKKVSRVALVTDSFLGDFGEKIVEHFVSAEIKSFPFSQLSDAKDWISDTESG